MQQINFQKVTSLFIKTVRGDQSQESLSQDLEANFNIVGRWETGQRGFYWEDFLTLAQLKKWDIALALQKVTHFEFSPWPSGGQVLSEIILPSSRDLLKSHFSVQKLGRLMADQSKLLFDDFLLMIEILYGRSQRFLSFFVPEGTSRYFDPLYSQHDHYREAMSRDPRLTLLRMILNLESYRALPFHSDEFVARIMNISVDEVKNKLDLLCQLGVVLKDSTHYRSHDAFVDTGAKGRAGSIPVSDYWRQQVGEYAEQVPGQRSDLLSAYLIFGTNKELDERIFEICRKFYIDVKNTVAEYEITQAQDNVRLLLVDLFYPLGNVLNTSSLKKPDLENI